MSSPTFERHALAGLVDGLRRHADDLRQRFEIVWPSANGAAVGPPPVSDWPRVNLHDEGRTLVLKADVPGVSERALRIALEGGAVVLSGERAVTVPAGCTVHRRERKHLRFVRRVPLPHKVDPAHLSASVRDGVLTLRMVKAPSAQPRQIEVRPHGEGLS